MPSLRRSTNVSSHPATTRTVLPVLVSAALLLGVYYVITVHTTLVNPLFFPSPIHIFRAALSLGAKGIAADVFATISRVMIAFLLSILVALPVALFMSESPWVKRLLTPYIDFIRYIPVPVLIPLTILFFGIGEESKIILLFIGTFFQIVLLFDADLARVPKEYFDLAYSLHFTTAQRLKMKLHAAFPEMYDNMRISLGLSWSYVVIAELVAAQTGIGHMLKEAQRFSLTATVVVGILLMGIIGFLSDLFFRKTYEKFFPYKSL